MTSESTTSLPASRRWWVLAGLVLAVIAFDLNLTMINIALPSLALEMDASASQLQWLSSSYSLMVAATLLPSGLLGDRFGAKRPLLIALVVLAATSLLCTQAGSAEALIAGQVVLGASAGFLPALSLALVNTVFPPEQRPRALAIWSIGLTIGIPLGPIIGGLLIAQVGWAGIYLLNLPLVLGAAALLALLLPTQQGARSVRIDGVGALLSSLAIVLVTYGLTHAGEAGWAAPTVLAAIGGGIGLLAVFAAWVRRSAHPLVDASLLRPLRFRHGVVLSTLVTFTLMGALFTMPQYLNVVHGAGPLATGVQLMPIVAGLLVGVLAAEALGRRIGLEGVTALGFGLLAVATVLGATTAPDAPFTRTAIWLTIAGIGVGFALPSAISTAMAAVPEERSGIGSGVLQVVRQIGGTFGIALLGTLLASVYSARLDVSGLSDEQADEVRRTASAGIAHALEQGDEALAESVRSAFVAGMSATLWVSAGVAALGCALALVISRRRADPRGVASEGTAVVRAEAS